MTGHFQTTCPRCYDLQPADARNRCHNCGSQLTISRAEVQSLTADLPRPPKPRHAVDRRPFTARRGPLNG